jgi:hypothetical protein
MPYRDEKAPPELRCPRCAKPLPAVDVAKCQGGCGTWISTFASTEILSEDERRENHQVRWWRVRAPCLICAEKMTLRNSDPGLFQGCTAHGFWIDADTIQHTGLARGVDESALERKRNDRTRMEAEHEAIQHAETATAEQKLQAARREAEVSEHFAEAKAKATEEQRIASRVSSLTFYVSGTGLTTGFTAGQSMAKAIVALEDKIKTLEARIATLEAASKS